MIDVRMFTVGPVQENTYIVRVKDSDSAVIVDPGDEAPSGCSSALEALGIEHVDAILLTHTHFDHVGAVAPVARATGAPVYCPELETAGAGQHHGLRAVAGLRAVRELRRRRDGQGRRDAGARGPALRGHASRPATAPDTSAMRCPTRGRCSPATCCSRARSGASTCPAATGRRCWPRSSR